MSTKKQWELGWRDKVVHAICTFIINILATKEYRAFLTVVTDLGCKEVSKVVEVWHNEQH